MYINLRKTLNQIEKALPQEGVQDLSKLQKAYEVTLHLRSQIIGVIYDMKHYNGLIANDVPKQEIKSNKQVVTLIIPEPLPGMKELTGAVEEHWVTTIHEAIEQESQTGIPKFQKAMVMIEITTPRGTDNPKVWDTSNRAINLVINNLKGIFSGMTILRIWHLALWQTGAKLAGQRSVFASFPSWKTTHF